ncbi:MAG TPA: phosphatase PAP2 family protein [Acidobacteriota bacterium]|nr:phosphatase PAP2 family protein [Acidobacteriota bacterium]
MLRNDLPRRLVQAVQHRRLPAPVVLLLLCIILLGAWVFVELTEGVLEAEIREWDEGILLALREPGNLRDPIGPRWLEQAALDITALGGTSVLTLITLIVIGFLWLVRKRALLMLAVASIVGGVAVSYGLKDLINRPRPSAVPHLAVVYSPSFPSGHAFMSAVVYLTLGLLLFAILPRRRLKLYVLFVSLLLTFLIGLTRVYLGVHYPTDVLAGWTGGLVWALLCWMLARWLQRRGSVESDKETTGIEKAMP